MKASRHLFLELILKPDLNDPLADSVALDIRNDLKIKGLKRVRLGEAYYFLNSGLKEKNLVEIAEKILVDPVMQSYSINKLNYSGFNWLVKVFYHDNITDNVALVALQAFRDIKINLDKSQIKSARHYYLSGKLGRKEVEFIAKKLLSNDNVESFEIVKGRN